MKRPTRTVSGFLRRSLLGALTTLAFASSLTTTAFAATPPTITGTPGTSATVGASYSFKPAVTPGSGKTVSFVITNRPSWAAFNYATGALTGMPTAANVGTFSNIIITAWNYAGSKDLTFAINVKGSSGSTSGSSPPPTNHAPTIAGTPTTTDTVGKAYIFTPTASDADGNKLTFSAQNAPSWSIFNQSTGQLSGTPTAAQVGTYPNIVISVSDGTATAKLPAFGITVATSTSAGSGVPTISGTPATSDTVGTTYSFTPKTTDPSGRTLTFSATNRPSWLTLNSSTGLLSGTPSASNVGTYANILISVSDGKSSASLPGFTLTVAAAGGSSSASGTATVKWTAPTQNSDGTALTNLAGYYVTYGTSSGNLNQSAQVASASATSYTVTKLTSGTWYFAVKSYTTSGTTSPLSKVASKTIQ